MSSMGSIEMLIMGEYVIKRKPADVRRLLGEKNSQGILTPPSNPRRAGYVNYETKFTVGNNDDDGVETTTRVSMPDRIIHDERNGGWFELLDDLEGELLGICNGKTSVNDVMNQYLSTTAEEMVGDDAETEEYQEILFSNILRRLTRLYDHTLISW